MEDPERHWTKDQLESDAVSKKELCIFLQEHASLQFLREHRLKGALKNVVKTSTKDKLIAAYNELFETKAFKKEGVEEEEENTEGRTGDASKEIKAVTAKTGKISLKEEDEVPPKYTKRLLKKGDKVNFPKKGDTVECFYKGTLEDGTVFDTNMTAGKKGKKPQALKFKVGVGKVIKGWDVGIQTMSKGEKAEFIIEPEWAYGKKGVEGRVPPNAKLIFEVELVNTE